MGERTLGTDIGRRGVRVAGNVTDVGAGGRAAASVRRARLDRIAGNRRQRVRLGQRGPATVAVPAGPGRGPSRLGDVQPAGVRVTAGGDVPADGTGRRRRRRRRRRAIRLRQSRRNILVSRLRGRVQRTRRPQGARPVSRDRFRRDETRGPPGNPVDIQRCPVDWNTHSRRLEYAVYPRK